MCEIFSPRLISFAAAWLETMRNRGRRESSGVRNISTPAHRPTRICHRPPSRRWLSHRTGRRLGRPGTQEIRTPHDENPLPPFPTVADNVAEDTGCGVLDRAAGNVPFVWRPDQIHLDRGFRCKTEAESPEETGPISGRAFVTARRCRSGIRSAGSLPAFMYNSTGWLRGK